jgi:hypothetical protein
MKGHGQLWDEGGVLNLSAEWVGPFCGYMRTGKNVDLNVPAPIHSWLYS